MPTLMKERLPAEIVYEQIPNIRAQLCARRNDCSRAYTLRRREATSVTALRPAAPTRASAAAMPDVSEHAVLKTPSAAEKPMGGSDRARHAARPGGDRGRRACGGGRRKPGRRRFGEMLAEFIERQLLPYLQARRGEKFRLGNAREADETFRHLKLRVAGAYRARVDEMQGWCDERRLLDVQTRMQHWLHGWLLVHVPLSFLLLLLTAWHAFVTLFITERAPSLTPVSPPWTNSAERRSRSRSDTKTGSSPDKPARPWRRTRFWLSFVAIVGGVRGDLLRAGERAAANSSTPVRSRAITAALEGWLRRVS